METGIILRHLENSFSILGLAVGLEASVLVDIGAYNIASQEKGTLGL